MIFTRFRLAVWALAAGLLFAVLEALVPNVIIIAIFNGIFLGIIVAIAIVYAPSVWYSLKLNRFDRVSQLSVGIGLLWLSTAIARAWSFLFRYNGAPEAWQNSWVISLIAYLAIIGGALFVTAPGYPPVDVTEPIALWGANRKLLLTLGAIGGITTFVLSVYPGIRV